MTYNCQWCPKLQLTCLGGRDSSQIAFFLASEDGSDGTATKTGGNLRAIGGITEKVATGVFITSWVTLLYLVFNYLVTVINENYLDCGFSL